MHCAAVLQIANHCYGQFVDRSDFLTNSEYIEECLCWMLSDTVAGINDWFAAIVCGLLLINKKNRAFRYIFNDIF